MLRKTGLRRVARAAERQRPKLAGRGTASRQPGVHRRHHGMALGAGVLRQESGVRGRTELGRLLRPDPRLPHRGDVFRAVASSDGGERSFRDCKGNPGAFIRYRPTGANAADSRKARDFILERNSCSRETEKTDLSSVSPTSAAKTASECGSAPTAAATIGPPTWIAGSGPSSPGSEQVHSGLLRPQRGLDSGFHETCIDRGG